MSIYEHLIAQSEKHLRQISKVISEVKKELNKTEIVSYFVPNIIYLPTEFLRPDSILTDLPGLYNMYGSVGLYKPVLNQILENCPEPKWTFCAAVENIVSGFSIGVDILSRVRLSKTLKHKVKGKYKGRRKTFTVTHSDLIEIKVHSEREINLLMHNHKKKKSIAIRLQKHLKDLPQYTDSLKEDIKQIPSAIRSQLKDVSMLLEHVKCHILLQPNKECTICSSLIDTSGYVTYNIYVPVYVYEQKKLILQDTLVISLVIGERELEFAWHVNNEDKFFELTDIPWYFNDFISHILLELGASEKLIQELEDTIDYGLYADEEVISVSTDKPETIPVNLGIASLPIPKKINVYTSVMEAKSDTVMKLELFELTKDITDIRELNLTIIDCTNKEALAEHLDSLLWQSIEIDFVYHKYT